MNDMQGELNAMLGEVISVADANVSQMTRIGDTDLEVYHPGLMRRLSEYFQVHVPQNMNWEFTCAIVTCYPHRFEGGWMGHQISATFVDAGVTVTISRTIS